MANHSSDDLMRAVQKGDVDKASELINTLGLSYSKVWSGGYVLLCDALVRNDKKIAKMLLEHDSMVNKDEKPQKNTPLHFAVKNNDAEIVAMLLDKKANINSINHLGETPLHLSIKENNLVIASLLLSKNADVNAVQNLPNSGVFDDSSYEKNGYTPLHCACASDREEMVKLLLKSGANINARTKKHSTALHIAAAKKCDKIMKVLLEHNGVDIHAENDRGKTVLNVAIEQGHLPTIKKILEICPRVINNKKNRHCIRDSLHRLGNPKFNSMIVKTFLSHGISIPPEDVSDRELLHNAVLGGFTKIVEDFLRYGADVNSPDVQTEGYTIMRQLLHNAVCNKQLDMAEMLINHGADVNAIDKTGKTPIFYAIEGCNVKMTKFLLSRGAKIKFSPYVLRFGVTRNIKEIIEMMLKYDVNYNIMAKDRWGRTALWYVVHLANSSNYQKGEDDYRIERDLAELLLSRGAKVNMKNAEEDGLLHFAARNARADMVEILLKYKADLNFAPKISMNTPLHYSAMVGNEKISRMLLNAGASINAKNKKGKTALHFACNYQSENKYPEKLVETLLEFGAEIDRKDDNGFTPLHIAAIKGSWKIVETLLASFANVECTNLFGKTALFDASKFGWPKIVKELLDYGAVPNLTCKKCHSSIDYTTLGLCRYNEDFLFEHHEFDYDIYDYPVKFHLISGKPVEMIKKHIIKIQSLNVHDIERNNAFVKVNDEFQYFRSECESEVGLMKNERIGETNISYYDVLIKSTNQLAMLARNEDIVEVLECSRGSEKFPIYYKMLYYKSRKGQKRRDLYNSSLKSLIFLSTFSLPEFVSWKLLSELSNKELENLIKAGPGTQSRSTIR